MPCDRRRAAHHAMAPYSYYSNHVSDDPCRAMAGELPHDPHSGVYAVLLFTATLATLLLPFPRGALLLRSARRLLLSPFVSTYLWDAFVADAVTSLVKPLVDFAYSLCFIGSGEWLYASHGVCLSSPLIGTYVTPILCALPLWIRFMQNLRVYHDTHRRAPFCPHVYGKALGFRTYRHAQARPLFAQRAQVRVRRSDRPLWSDAPDAHLLRIRSAGLARS